MTGSPGSFMQLLQARLLQGPLQQPADSGDFRLALAYSGGLDSHVLLHALSRLGQQADLPHFSLRALHINHGLSAHADAWQQHCTDICEQLAVPLMVQRVDVSRAAGESLEEQARLARYDAFASLLQMQEHLLLAHHLDDQAETLLLRLLRGAGPQGLSAMPRERMLGQGRLWRPLLDLPRSLLEEYALAEGLTWISDESNADTRFDRNYLRQQVFPLLQQRWPSYRQSWLRSATLSAEAQQLNNELAALDLAHCQCEEPDQLDCLALAKLSPPRQRNVLRFWLAQIGFSDPGWQILHRCVSEVLPAAGDAQPLLSWSGLQIRRYRQRLYALCELPPVEDGSASFDLLAGLQQIDLPGNGTLYFQPVIGEGLRVPLHGLQIGYRQDGLSCRLANRPRRPLKKILHDADVPPWLRSRLPLLQQDGETVCIPGIGSCGKFAATAGQPGVLVYWEPPR